MRSLLSLQNDMTAPILHGQLAVDNREAPTERAISRIVADVRICGYALTSGGFIPGVTGVAAPVFGVGECLPLVVAIAMPARQGAGGSDGRTVGLDGSHSFRHRRRAAEDVTLSW